MINSVSSVSFKGNPYELSNEKRNASDATVGVVAAGGAVTAVSRGRRALQSVSSVSNRASIVVKSVPKNTSRFKAAFIKAFDFAKGSKIFKPIVAMTKTKLFGKVAGAVGAVSALGVAATSVANIINTSSKVADKYM